MIFRSLPSLPCLRGLLFCAPLVACGIRTPLELEEASLTIEKDAGHPVIAPVVDAGAPFDADTHVDSGEAIDDAGAGIDVALPAADLGDILLTSGAYSSGSGQTLKTAAVFYPSVAATGCTVALVAGCKIETCTATTPGGAPLASAGSIAITGGAYPLVLQPGSGNLYGTPVPDGDSGVEVLWHGNETLHVSASGADVPAFTADVLAPTQVTVVTQLPTSISRLNPFDVSWFKKSAGQVAVDVSSTAGGTSYYLECLFDVAAGFGEVPQAALAQIAGGTGTLSVFTVTKQTVSAGGWTVGTFAQTDANDPNGAEWAGPIGIQ
jgi:hypothetical protein